VLKEAGQNYYQSQFDLENNYQTCTYNLNSAAAFFRQEKLKTYWNLAIANIARQLRTQYVEGIYDNSVTLKCGSEVTQGVTGNGTIW